MLQSGKLPPALLSELLGGIKVRDPRVVLGARAGEDAALIDMGERYLVAKTDPITFATDYIGWYLVQVNANDLAVMGARPQWLMVTLLLPVCTAADEVRRIFAQLLQACDALGVTLIGGHTEVTHDLRRPIAMGAMLGEVAKHRVTLTSGAQPGDAIVMTQGVAIEGTAILAREAADVLTARGVPQRVIARAQDLLFEPGISVVRAASIASDIGVNAMHDSTEGGLATALREVGSAAGVGVRVDADRIPILSECRTICGSLGLDPLGLIASGTLLATLPSERAARLVAALGDAGIPASIIGSVTSAQEALMLTSGETTQALPTFGRDELARFFDDVEDEGEPA